MTENLFETQDTEIEIDPNKNYLEELVGDGRKFKTVDDLAKGKYESDLYINSLTKNLDELREDYMKLRSEYTARASLQEMVDQLSKDRQLTSRDDTDDSKEDDKPGLVDLTQIDELVSKKIQEKEVQRKQEENFNTVKARLVERYGKNFANVIKEQQEVLGLSTDYVNSIARSSPQAFFRLMGLDTDNKQNTFQSPPRSQRSDSFSPRLPEKRTWSYYEKMRKDNPTLYNDPKTHVQMHKDRVELGQEFEDGSWNT